MTATPTALSIQKTATLLQNLVDLKIQTDIGFPSIIDKCVAELLDAQSAFVKQIDKYMHGSIRDVDEVETMKIIIETCPDFMATKDEDGDLPIHCSAYDDLSYHIFVPLLADMGRRHGIGGVDGRGGLLMDSTNGIGSKNTLHYLTDNPSPSALKALMNVEPPLFYKQDVHDYNLLHDAAYDRHIEVVKFMVELDASCLYSCDKCDKMPIAWFYDVYVDGDSDSDSEPHLHESEKMEMLEMLQYLLEAAVTHDADHPTIGGLFSKYGDSEQVVLKHIIDLLGEEDAWDCIQKALSSFDSIPILHKTIQYAPRHYCSTVLTRFPDSVFVRDDKNRLPVHVALESGMSWSLDLVSIINANQSHLGDNDPVTGWPPFILAAMEPSCGLRTLYHLLKKHPEHGQKIDNDNDNQSQE